VLADANTVESYKIEEKGFIVCMVSKVIPPPRSYLFHANAIQPKAAPAPKPAPPQTPAQPASTPAAPAAPQQQPAPATSNAPATPTPAQPAAAAPADSQFNDPSANVLGTQHEGTVREMEAMGFARPEINRALRAAYFNPDRAIEYLLTGIPEHIQAEQRQAQQNQQAAPPAAPAAGATATGNAPTAPAAEPSADEGVNLFDMAAAAGNRGSGGARGGAAGGAAAAAGLGAGAGAAAGGGQMNMDFLRNSAYFQQLRQLVQQQPAMLEPILQQVAEGNPQLAQMIGQNQEQFLQLLAEVSLP
jgi:UV excision repair protein RAD23